MHIAMKTFLHPSPFPLLTLLASLVVGQAQTTTFTYQGHLLDHGAPANGNYDLQFTLRDALTAGNQVGSALSAAPVGVTNGLFTVALDFGAGAFPGTDRWLELGVRTNGSAVAHTLLSPRQAVTTTPYALRAASAASLSGPLPATSLTGTLADARLGTNIARLTVPNTTTQATGTVVITSGFITGANVTSGGSGYLTPPPVTVTDSTGSGAVLTANVSGGAVVSLSISSAGNNYSADTSLTIAPPPSNAYQVFSGTNLFNGVNTFTNPLNAFVGDGTGLTSLPAANVTGTLPDARLSTNVALLNGGPIFGGGVTAARFSGDGSALAGLWRLGGNNGTTPGAQFLGTADNQPLEFKVNNQRALRLEPNAAAGAPNLIGGAELNFIAPGVVGATIAGGGATNYFGSASTNSVAADFGSIGGGFQNNIQTNAAYSTIGGGVYNIIQTSATSSTIGGGFQNNIQANAAYSTIAGGIGNYILANYATIPGGAYNTATNFAFAAGTQAKAIHTGAFVWADLIGPVFGSFADFTSTASNQFLIRASGGVGIGTNNPHGALEVVVAPGQSLQFRQDGGVAPGLNIATTGGNAGTLRLRNTLEIWPSDNATRAGKVDVRGTNGAPAITLDGSNGRVTCVTLSQTSDRAAKENFVPVNARDVLRKVASLPLSRWNYKQDAATPHLGPMAQDFHAAFGLGADDRHIATVDEGGVALAAIQGLHQLVTEKDARIQRLEADLTELKTLVQKLVELSKGSAR